MKKPKVRVTAASGKTGFRVGAGILINPEPYMGKARAVTGPRNLSQSEIAEISGNALGKPADYKERWLQMPCGKESTRSLITPHFIS